MASPGASPGQRLRELIEALMGLPLLRELEGRYLSAAERERKYGGEE